MKGVIIGLGSIARKHIDAINQIDQNIELFALRSSKKSAPYKNVINIFSIAEIEKIAPSFIMICNPTALHLNTIKEVLPMEIPLFIEKPVVSDPKEALGILAEIKERGILTYTACNLRFFACLRFLKKYLDESQKKINEVNIYCGSFLPDWRPNSDYKKSYSAIPELGGGVHLDLIHEIDYLYWLLGKPEEVRSIFRSQSSINIEAIDYAHYTLLYPSFVANITLNYFRKGYKRIAEILLEDRTIIMDFGQNKVFEENGKVLFESDQKQINTYLPQLEYFLELVKTKASSSFNSFEDSLEVLKIGLNE